MIYYEDVDKSKVPVHLHPPIYFKKTSNEHILIGYIEVEMMARMMRENYSLPHKDNIKKFPFEIVINLKTKHVFPRTQTKHLQFVFNKPNKYYKIPAPKSNLNEK
jgi:hypothetical protein